MIVGGGVVGGEVRGLEVISGYCYVVVRVVSGRVRFGSRGVAEGVILVLVRGRV